MRQILLLAALSLTATPPASSQWSQANGPYAGYLTSLAISGGNIFVGADEGVYLSTNTGSNWQTVSVGLPSVQITCLAARGSTILAGTEFNGVFRSSDNGSNWGAIVSAPIGYGLNAFAVKESTIFLGGAGLFVSTDDGRNWTESDSGLTDRYVMSLLVSHANLIAGTPWAVFVSTNGGRNWIASDSGHNDRSIYCLASNESKVFAGIGGWGLLSSTDDGLSWELNDSISKSFDVRSIAARNADVLVATPSGMFYSSDNGSTWVTRNQGLTNYNIAASAFLDDTTVVACSRGSGFFLSTDKGRTWANRSTGLAPSSAQSFAVGGGSAYAGTDAGLYKSNDCGASWSPVNFGGGSVLSLAETDSGIFAGTAANQVFLSKDGGASWTWASYGLPYDWEMPPSVLCLSSEDSIIWAGMDDGVFFSTNDGTSWDLPRVGGPFLASVSAIAFTGQHVFIATLGTGIFRMSRDRSGWQSTDSGLTTQTVNSLVAQRENVFAGTTIGVFRSTDEGLSWQSISGGLKDTNVIALAAKDTNLFAGLYRGGIYHSSIRNGVWHSVAEGLPLNTSVRCITFEDSLVLIGTLQGVWRRPLSEMVSSVRDRGNAWPKTYALLPNYPNPFNPATTITYELPVSSYVMLKVFDLLGQELVTLVNDKREPGKYTVTFDGSKLSSGMYFYRIVAGEYSATRKMVLVK